jgi:hypothetical protein
MLSMKKRGPVVLIVGGILILSSFAVAISLLQQNGFENDLSLPLLLEGMFDHVTENTQIRPGEVAVFPFYAHGDTKQILWGLQILDYSARDTVAVSISNIYGDNFGTHLSDQPAFFKTLDLRQSEDLNFSVENRGQRTINVVMMFTNNPDEQDRMVDPNSPLGRALVPLAAVGLLLIAGIIVIVVGIVLTVLDYKKRQNSEFI